MDEFERFREDFKQLVDTTYCALHKKEKTYSRQHLSVLYCSIFHLDIREYISKEEIEQELAFIWLKSLKAFQESKPNIHVRQYLIRRSLWGLRDWLRTVAARPIGIPFEDITVEEKEIPQSPFSLDLKFLIYGTDFEPLMTLTPYERYLVFLKFREDKTMLEIAHMVQKNHETIYEHFNQIISKIRSIQSYAR